VNTLRQRQTAIMVGLTLTAWLAAGCAGAARISATERITAAERSIREATQSDAALTAAPDLDTAQTKLGEAKAAADEHSWGDAGRLADEARADAEYARARAVSQKTAKTSQEMRQNVQLLRQELERTGR
jgi:biopolymer transport protein ExbB/TolQ